MPSITAQVLSRILRKAKRLFDAGRHRFFTKDVDERDVRVHASVDELRTVLGDEYFTKMWELSYNYKGEDMNMRRQLRKPDQYEWYQTHVRGWESDDGSQTKIEAHEGFDPTEYPYYHLRPPEDASLDQQNAVDDVLAILDDANIEYEVL